MAHKKAGGSSRNGRDSAGRRLGDAVSPRRERSDAAEPFDSPDARPE